MSDQIVPSSGAPFPVRVVRTSASMTITGLITNAVVDVLISVPLVIIQSVTIAIEQGRADIDVEFYRIGAETNVRKQLVAADAYVAGMVAAHQASYPDDVKEAVIDGLNRQLKAELQRYIG